MGMPMMQPRLMRSSLHCQAPPAVWQRTDSARPACAAATGQSTRPRRGRDSWVASAAAPRAAAALESPQQGEGPLSVEEVQQLAASR